MSAPVLLLVLASSPPPAESLFFPERVPGIEVSAGIAGSAAATFVIVTPVNVFGTFVMIDASVGWRAESPFAVRLRLWPLLFHRGLPPLVMASLDAMLDWRLVGVGVGVATGRPEEKAAVPLQPAPSEALNVLPNIRLGASDGLMGSFQLRAAMGPTARREWTLSITGFEARLQLPVSPVVRLLARAAAVLHPDLTRTVGLGELGVRVPLGGVRSRFGITFTAGVGFATAVGPMTGVSFDWRG